MVLKPCVMIQIHFSKNHVYRIVIDFTHSHFITALIFNVIQFRNQKIPNLLRFSLLGLPASRMIIRSIQWNVTEQIKQNVIIQCTISTKLCN